MLIIKNGFRLFYKRKLETIAVILLLFFASSMYLALYIDKDNFIYYVNKAMVESLGHVSVFGAFNGSALDIVKGIDGVERVTAYYYWKGIFYIERNVSSETVRVKEDIVLVDEAILHGENTSVHIVLKEGRYPENIHEAIVYTPVYGGEGSMMLPKELQVGSTITVYSYGHGRVLRKYNLTIVGRAIGLGSYSSPGEYTIFVKRSLIREVTSGSYSWIVVYSSNEDDEYIEELGNKVINELKRNGYYIVGSWINKPGENRSSLKTIYQLSKNPQAIDPLF